MITVRAIERMVPGDVLNEHGITVQRQSAARWLVAVGDAKPRRVNSARRATELAVRAIPTDAIRAIGDAVAQLRALRRAHGLDPNTGEPRRASGTNGDES